MYAPPHHPSHSIMQTLSDFLRDNGVNCDFYHVRPSLPTPIHVLPPPTPPRNPHPIPPNTKHQTNKQQAGQSTSERSAVLAAWQRGQVPLVCATIAMGMGVDVANVRFILHATMAKSVEGYYQARRNSGIYTYV